jgi:acyl-coenzyme A thioesterase PaaI-like protein
MVRTSAGSAIRARYRRLCNVGQMNQPVSAARVAELLGDALPDPAQIPAEAFDLVAVTRALVEAVVMTDVDAGTRAEAAAELRRLAEVLGAARRADQLFLARHADGRVESLTQAGSGRLNPQAPPIEWIERPKEPPPGSPPTPVEVRARCTFGPQHAGSPGRVYGGVLACALDEVLGIAVLVSGATGMTVALTTSLTGGTPYGVPVDIVGRYTGSEGRKSFASGEVVVDGQVTAEATAIFVGERR